MIGMDSMSGAVKPLQQVEGFRNLMIQFSDIPILGVIAGLVLTAIIQSSSASVGILQAFCKTGVLKFSAALPIIMGQNIGTCVTAMLSSIGAKKNAKRAAVVHLCFNIIGTILFMAVFYTINTISPFKFMNGKATEAGIAVIHTTFNISVTLVLVWFSKWLEKLACIIIKDNDNEAEVGTVTDALEILDNRFLGNPALAMEHAKDTVIKMAYLSKEVLDNALSLLKVYDKDVLDKVSTLEELIDNYEDKLGSYLMKLTGKELSEQDSIRLPLYIHMVNDYERISDHAMNIAELAKKMNKKNLAFSKKASKELDVFSNLIQDIVINAIKSFENEDIDTAMCIEPMEEVADKLNKQMKKRHKKRLENGKCTIEMGFILSDITTNYERIADHCSNIAIGIIQSNEDIYESHEYLETLDKGENTLFHKKYEEYKERYILP